MILTAILLCTELLTFPSGKLLLASWLQLDWNQMCIWSGFDHIDTLHGDVYIHRAGGGGVAQLVECCWSHRCSAILCSRADSLCSHVILYEWLAFYGTFLNIDWSAILTVLFDCYMAGAAWNCCHLGAFCVYRTIMHYVKSLHAKPHTQSVWPKSQALYWHGFESLVHTRTMNEERVQEPNIFQKSSVQFIPEPWIKRGLRTYIPEVFSAVHTRNMNQNRVKNLHSWSHQCGSYQNYESKEGVRTYLPEVISVVHTRTMNQKRA